LIIFIIFFAFFSIGTRHFWRAAHFSVIYDSFGQQHDVYLWVDCITPSIANYFYVLIALCCAIIFASSFASALNIFLPPFGFFQWLRKNTLLEFVTFIMLCIFSECQYVSTVKIGVTVAIGCGLFLVAGSGVSSFFAAAASLRRTNRLALSRRLQNQQMLCARSLLSWRDIGRQPEDMRAILQFEEYLDSSQCNINFEKDLFSDKF
uniref:TMEM127 domain-containing protein n=1 Tax=Syphacia muris TaxID=451379 RepID=A0A0N5AL74_9BILA